MSKAIENPHKVSIKIYIILLSVSLLVLFISIFLPVGDNTLLINLLDILKNLSYGCIASTLVALFIDCANTRNLNKKANNVYDAIYIDLKFQISHFMGLWAEICAVSYKNVDYYQEKHTWICWYNIVKENYNNSDKKRQNELIDFFISQLKYCVEKVNNSIKEIHNQRYLLAIHDLHNSKLMHIISDFKFEFHVLEVALSHDSDIDKLWSHLDAVTNDIENYVNNWVDISYYNKLKFKPFDFHSDTNDILKAILLEKEVSEYLVDLALKTVYK